MKVIHIPAREKTQIVIPEEVIGKLPEAVALFTPVQYTNQLKDIKGQLEKAGKKVELLQTRHTWAPGQILGCNVERYQGDFDEFFFVGDGVFHPKALLMKNNQDIHCYNPKTREYFVMTRKDMEKVLKKVRAARAAFFHAKTIGVLVTTKTGQRGFKYKWAKELEEKYPDKKFYYLMQNNIDFQELGNFPFIDVFLNTACERIGLDDTLRTEHIVLNVEDVEDDDI